jgi:hypothetical protein
VNKTVVIGIVFVLGILGFLIYSSLHIAKQRVEICVAFNGRTSCRVASADTQEHAMHTAQSNACALIASGVTDTMQCERTIPASVTWLERK